MATPLYKRIELKNTKDYVFPSVAKDISLANNNPNIKMVIDKFVLLELPTQNLLDNIDEVSFDFETNFKRFNKFPENLNFADSFIHSLRNYVANHIEIIRSSYIGNNKPYYNSNELKTVDEYIFWKWLKKLNILNLEPAIGPKEITSWFWETGIPKQEWSTGSGVNQTIVRTDTELTQNKYHELLWKQKESLNFDLLLPYPQISFKLDNYKGINGYWIILNQLYDLRSSELIKIGDRVIFNTNNEDLNNSDILIKTQIQWLTNQPSSYLETINSHKILNVNKFFINNDYWIGIFIQEPTKKPGVNFEILHQNYINYNGKITLNTKVNNVVKYIGEITSITNSVSTNANHNITSVVVPALNGKTPLILFKTANDSNYKPNQTFPFLEEEQIKNKWIKGSDSPDSPINKFPQEFPGNKISEVDRIVDNIKYTYQTSKGDFDKKTGDYFGVFYEYNKYNSGDPSTIRKEDVITDNIDGINLDFILDHYADINNLENGIFSFNQYNSFSPNNNPPDGFKFNAMLLYYTITDINTGNSASNIHSLILFGHPDDNPIETGLKFPTIEKIPPGNGINPTTWMFDISETFDINNDNVPTIFNPQLTYTQEFLNLYNIVLQEILRLNDSYNVNIQQMVKINDDVNKLKSLFYSQTSIDIINQKISYLEELLTLYKTNGFGNSDSIEFIQDNSTSPPTIRAFSKDPEYIIIYDILTSGLYNKISLNPVNQNIGVANGKNFLINIVNNDNFSVNLNENEYLSITIDRDLDYKQKLDIIIKPNNSITNKKLNINLNFINQNNLIETINLIEKINLPIDLLGESQIPEFNFIEEDPDTETKLEINPKYSNPNNHGELNSIIKRINNFIPFTIFDISDIQIREIPSKLIKIIFDKKIDFFLEGDWINLNNFNFLIYFDSENRLKNNIKNNVKITDQFRISEINKSLQNPIRTELLIDISNSQEFDILFDSFKEVNNKTVDLQRWSSLLNFLDYTAYPTIDINYGMKISITRINASNSSTPNERYLIEKIYYKE